MEKSKNREYVYQEYEAWKKETSFLSVGQYENEHFDNIVKMGENVLPYLIEVLEQGPNHLVHACDLIFPGEVEYNGYIPLDFGCKVWVEVLKTKLVKDVLKSHEISEQINQP